MGGLATTVYGYAMGSGQGKLLRLASHNEVSMTQAFAGIKVIDFTQVLAGPFATQQLAQCGAEVIKIEPLRTGDMTRRLMSGTAKGDAPSFLTCNLGKKSVALDLKSSAAKEVIHSLVSGADVVVENFRPGVMQRLGLDYDRLSAIREDIVYCSISGFGQTGPAAHKPAYDGAIQAASGMMAVTGHPETGPTRTGYMPVDMATALNAAFAIATALYRRKVTGAGEHLDIAMLDTAMVLQAPQVSAHLVTGAVPELLGNRSPTKAPTANLFECADGALQVVAMKESQVEALFDALDLTEHYAEFAGEPNRIAQTQQINALIEPVFAAGSVEHWQTKLDAAGVPAAVIRSYKDLVTDEQLAGRPIFAQTQVSADTQARVVSASHTARNDPPQVARPAPDLGEHTDAVLRELGFDEAKIDEWRREESIG